MFCCFVSLSINFSVLSSRNNIYSKRLTPTLHICVKTPIATWTVWKGKWFLVENCSHLLRCHRYGKLFTNFNNVLSVSFSMYVHMSRGWMCVYVCVAIEHAPVYNIYKSFYFFQQEKSDTTAICWSTNFLYKPKKIAKCVSVQTNSSRDQYQVLEITEVTEQEKKKFFWWFKQCMRVFITRRNYRNPYANRTNKIILFFSRFSWNLCLIENLKVRIFCVYPQTSEFGFEYFWRQFKYDHWYTRQSKWGCSTFAHWLVQHIVFSTKNVQISK